MRVADDVLNDGIAAVGVRVGAAVAERMVREALHLNGEIALLVVEERLAIADEILKIADLWPVYSRVVDLGNNAVPDREPETTGGRVRGAYYCLVAMGPAGLDPGLAECFCAVQCLHCMTSSPSRPFAIEQVGLLEPWNPLTPGGWRGEFAPDG